MTGRSPAHGPAGSTAGPDGDTRDDLRAEVLRDIAAVPRYTVPQHPVHRYDDLVPPGLAARWSGVDGDRAVLTDLAGFLVGAAAGTAAVVAGGALLLGIGRPGAAVALLGASVLAAVVAVLARRRDRARFTSAEIDLLLAHRTALPLDRWAGGDPPREARAAAVVDLSAERSAATPAWRRPGFAGLLSVPLAEQRRQLHVLLWEQYELRRALGDRPDARRCDPATSAAWQACADRIDAAWHEVVDRIAAWRALDARVTDLDRELTVREIATRLEGTAGGSPSGLLAATAQQQLVTAELDALRLDLARHAEPCHGTTSAPRR
ncbi:hypothetical protein [Nakamurella endophytica]|uniref:Uncharacterized protein n=1 Tax=Nakamurella endophytica TaxID=1748367 RepID=A0A917WER0_9ACTN|nr:hypothetical protein [Nakamurella endophytica]GGM00569.1 hypothetical protein GCM10011594_20850 [Nakamurella endophytica]